MRLARFLWAHLDSVVAVLLTAAYLGEVIVLERRAVGEPVIASLEPDETFALIAAAVFLLSLAVRSRQPLIPLALAYVALAAAGREHPDGSIVLAAGVVLAAYSVGAWAGGRAGQVGALAVGGLVGVEIARAAAELPAPRDVAIAVATLAGAWAIGLAMRSVRAGRGDERVVGELDWESAAGTPDSASRDALVREIRDVVERAMSAVILQARAASASIERDPESSRRSLRTIEAAGNDALVETQRLTGLLLSPDGAPLASALPGLADLDELAIGVTETGLPVDIRVEGRAVPLTADLDSVAYRVVYEALMSTLEHASAEHSNVVVRYEPEELQIEVVDDGVSVEGQDPEVETARLIAVRDDVAAIGGSLEAGPGKKRGYWVFARLPYEPDWE